MAYPTYLVLKGKSQGLISAGCSSQDSIGNRYQIGHEDEIQVIGLNSGSFASRMLHINPSYLLSRLINHLLYFRWLWIVTKC